MDEEVWSHPELVHDQHDEGRARPYLGKRHTFRQPVVRSKSGKPVPNLIESTVFSAQQFDLVRLARILHSILSSVVSSLDCHLASRCVCDRGYRCSGLPEARQDGVDKCISYADITRVRGGSGAEDDRR